MRWPNSSHRSMLILLIASLTLVALLTAACGPTPTPQVVKEVVTKVVEKPIEIVVTPTPGPKPKLVVALGADIDTLDPQAFKSIPGYYAIQNLYDQLLDYELEPYGNHWVANEDKPRPMLAESWEISDDKKTVTFKLRDGITFANGDPITSEDVVYTYERALKGGSYTGLLAEMLTITDAVKQIETPDPKTVIFHLNKPNPMTMKLLILNVVSILDKEELEKHATPDDPWANEWYKTNVVASGPYVLKSWTPGVGWELEPNPLYWNKDAVMNSGIVVKQIPEARDRLALLKSGAVDVAYDIPYRDLPDLLKDPNVQIVTRPSTWCWYLGMTNTIPPFDNVKVRQAISYAIPYDTIIERVVHGFARPLLSPVPPGMPTHDGSYWPYKTDLEKAKQLLAEAGYPNGFKTELNILVGREQDEETAVWIQANLQKIGVEVTINKMAAAQWYDKFNKHEHPMFLGEWFSWVNDPIYHIYWNFRSDALTNSVLYNNPELDALIKEAMYEPDPAKREALSIKAQHMIIDDAPWAFLYASDFIVAVGKDVKGYAIYPDQNPRWMYLTK